MPDISLADFMSERAEPVSVKSSSTLEERKAANRQLYDNSAHAQALAEQVMEMPEALANLQTPNLVIQHERPIHRMMLLLVLKGFSNREIAEQTGYTESWVSQVTRQPWFQERLAVMLAEAGEDVLSGLIKLQGKNSLDTLIQIRDDPKTPPNVRATVCMDLINRIEGKPVQRTESIANVFHVSAKVDDLDRQLAELKEAEAKLLTRGATINVPSEVKP